MIRLLVSGLALLAFTTAQAEWTVPTTGYDLLRGLENEREDVDTDAGLNAYARSVAAQAFVLGAFRAGIMYGEYCTPGRVVSPPDVILVVRVFLKQRPERLSEDSVKLIDYALAQAFPCRQ